MTDRPLADRFWAKVDKSAGPDGCWPWIGARHPDGYGHIRVGNKIMTSSRLAYELGTGQPLGELHALHRCSNSWCCNPAPIYAGDNRENSRDRTWAARERRARLPPEMVEAVRFWSKSVGITQPIRIARMLGVSRRTVQRIIRGEIYKNV